MTVQGGRQSRMGRGVRGLTVAAGRSPAPGSFQRPCGPSGLVGAGGRPAERTWKGGVCRHPLGFAGFAPEVAAYSQLLPIPIHQGPRDTELLEVRKTSLFVLPRQDKTLV